MFVFNGKEYKSVVDCCKDLEINYSAVIAYAGRNGVPYDEVIRRSLEKKNFVYRGQTYSSRNSCCKAFGIPYVYVKNQAETRNVDFCKALDICIDQNIKRGSQRVLYDGYIWKNKARLVEAYGLKKHSVYTYARNHKLTFVDAMDHMLQKDRGRRPTQEEIEENACFCFRGKYYSSISEVCGEYNLYYPNVKHSLTQGMTFVEALEYWVKQREERDQKGNIL